MAMYVCALVCSVSQLACACVESALEVERSGEARGQFGGCPSRAYGASGSRTRAGLVSRSFVRSCARVPQEVVARRRSVAGL